MGGEIAQYAEWNFERSLDWHLCDFPLHSGIQKMLSDLNLLYREERGLHWFDEKREGFEWIDDRDYSHNCLTFVRKSDLPEDSIYVVCNFADATRRNYKMGVLEEGEYVEIFNSQSSRYEGWDITNPQSIQSAQEEIHGRAHSITLTLPPLGVVYLKRRIDKFAPISKKPSKETL